MKGSITRALVLVLVLSSAAFGQFSYDFTGGGARAEGMGNAFLAVSDDVTGAGWNPAGLYTVEKPVIGLSWASLAPRGNSNILVFTNPSYSDHAGSFADLGSANFAAPFRVKGHPFVGSISYARSFDIFQSTEWDGIVSSDYDTTVNGILLRDTILTQIDGYETSEGGLNMINFAFGTRLYDKLSVGLSVNVYTGNYLHVVNDLYFSEDHLTGDGLQQGTKVVNYTRTDTSKFSGMNLVLGMKYTGEKTFAGLTIKTPFSLKVNSDTLIYSIVSFNDIVLDNETDTLYFMDNVVKYDMPWIVGAGIAYKMNDNWLVAADAEMRAFKGGKIKERTLVTINPGGDNPETYVEYDPRWRNVVTFRGGTEYLRQTGLGVIPVRAGIGYCQMPDLNVGVDFLGNYRTSTAVQYSFSLGTGIHWEQIHFDLAYSAKKMDRFEFGLYEYKVNSHHVNVSFTGVF